MEEQCISEKALREFLGYKSPTAKSERVLELISDFLFDVSHAMVSIVYFYWEFHYNAMSNVVSTNTIRSNSSNFNLFINSNPLNE